MRSGGAHALTIDLLRHRHRTFATNRFATGTFEPLLVDKTDDAAGSAEDGGGSLLAGGAFEKTRELNAAVRQRPRDEAAWLALAESLDAPIQAGGQSHDDRRGAAASAERKAEVLRRAVSANPESETLRLALLKACEAYLPHEEIDSEWQRAVKEMPTSVALWSSLLGRRGAAFGAYTAGAQRALGARAIRALAERLDGARAGGTPSAMLSGLERAILLLLSRAAFAEKSSGYSERALSLLMAAIEMSCFAPKSDANGNNTATMSSSRLYDLFEEFWEAEVPRIGESSAKGWSDWHEAGKPSEAAASTAEQPLADDDNGDGGNHQDGSGRWSHLVDESGWRDPSRRVYASWAATETRLDKTCVLPIRASSSPDAAEDDPERVVLAEDLRPFLVQLKSDEARPELFLAAASLLRVPHAQEHLPSSHPLAALCSAGAETAAELLPDNATPFIAAAGEGRRVARALLTSGCAAFPTDVRLARALLNTADQRTPIRKLAKSLLKRQPAYLPLWLVYADAEANLGNTAEARKVCLSALTLCAPPKGNATPMELLPIAHAAAKRAIEEADQSDSPPTKAAALDEALRLLVSAFVPEAAEQADGGGSGGEGGSSNKPSRPHVLLARRGFEREAKRLNLPLPSTPANDEAVAAVADLDATRESLLCAYALFEQLEYGLLAALAVHTTIQSALIESPCRLHGAGSREHERLIEHRHWLLQRHSAEKGRPPAAHERSLYDAVLSHFPANATILSTLASEGGLGSLGRFEVRRLLAHARTRHPECPQLWLCAIRFELLGGRPQHAQLAGSGDAARGIGGTSGGDSDGVVAVAEAGTERRVRALFEGALTPATCAGCPALWREYLRVELRMGRRDAACRLLLRAVQQCPGVKSLWIEVCNKPIVSFVPGQQLTEAMQLMVDKEVRLRNEPPEEAPPADVDLRGGGSAMPQPPMRGASAGGSAPKHVAESSESSGSSEDESASGEAE